MVAERRVAEGCCLQLRHTLLRRAALVDAPMRCAGMQESGGAPHKSALHTLSHHRLCHRRWRNVFSVVAAR